MPCVVAVSLCLCCVFVVVVFICVFVELDWLVWSWFGPGLFLIYFLGGKTWQLSHIVLGKFVS